MRLVVNVPTYNEKENIEEIIKKISQINPKVHYLDVKQKGLGVGIYKGHRWAIDKLKADILAQMDGDLSHDPQVLPQMVDYIKKGYDLVNGSRLISGGKNLLGLHRRIFTRGSALFCKI